ncbi:hypothetical protein E1202_06895 [Saccharopolyspora karakumensis]|uniref:Uncharacterized protein n=1 Tax=Saccharopolyspora karakumensis TaxID=2530386 RepID=A0A4V2YXV1_9PSEU|nr:hypothetical protein [Saccharopolyspora karakumensis]TDD90837.1 hypothetical protein E1202_06895 [Saccharopolyspora karakumensis]
MRIEDPGSSRSIGTPAQEVLLRRFSFAEVRRVTVDGELLREDRLVVRGAFAAGTCTYGKV